MKLSLIKPVLALVASACMCVIFFFSQANAAIISKNKTSHHWELSTELPILQDINQNYPEVTNSANNRIIVKVVAY